MTLRLNQSSLAQFIGRELGTSSWLTITQSDISKFAELGGDHQWIHVDLERAKAESPFGTTVAHGYFILSLAPRLMNEIFSFDDSVMGINRGLDRVRFITPLRSGDRVRAKLELMEFEVLSAHIDMKFKLTYEGEGYEKPICIAEILKRFYMKAAE